MPRDQNGNYALPNGNPVQTETLIASDWANSTMQDLAAEMTDSLSRSGKGGITGPFQIIDEEGSVPGLAFTNEPTTGLKRTGTGDVRMQVLGADKMRWLGSGDAQVLRNAAWNPVAIEPADRQVMYGEGGTTTLWHYGTTVAPGFELVEPDANIRSIIIGPAAGGGVIGGLEDPTNHTYNLGTTVTVSITGVTDGHALTAEENGPHTHDGQPMRNSDGLSPTPRSSSGGNDVQFNTPSSGSGVPHPHNITAQPGTGTGTGTLQVQPRYARGLLMKLTAYA